MAYGVAWLNRSPSVAAEKPVLNRRQLFQNYRIFKIFLNGALEKPPAERAASSPLLAAIVNLKRAQELFAAGKFSASAAALAAIPEDFPFLLTYRDTLRLKTFHASRSYAQFIAFSDARAPADLDTRVLRLDSLLKTRKPNEAFNEFKPLFARQRLESFSRHLSRPDLAALLKRLSEDDWLAKFSFLLKNGEGGEFRRELPFSGFRELNRLFQAEFAYRGRAYGRARQLLRAPFPGRYRDAAERLRIKMDVWDDPNLDLEERLRRPDSETLRTPDMLFDLGQILLSRREFDRAMPFFERYFASSGERDEEYWKTAWLLAWIHYRRDDKEQALKYFRLGSRSTVPGYRIASRYWQAKLEENEPPEMERYPFSYYAVKAFGDREGFKDLHLGFLRDLDDAPGPRFLEIVEELKVLAANGMWAEAAEAVHWVKGDPGLGAGDLNLLKVIESILHYRQSQYFTAYSKFRGNFPPLESVRLPNFLSGLFFPRAYEEVITAYSRKQEVDPNLVLALVREESFFRSDVRSPANALGLMQLLHGTARQVANGSGLKLKAKDLYNPEVNVRLGLAYLKTMLDRYDGRLYLALAAYNAGPHRVDQWRQDFPLADEEEFIEMIPFSETRTYVKNILRNYFFYRYYYENGKA